jgi:phosphatidylserine/phosphatidylglycerophosphate/cardiolipin synthase-like enzyme
MCDSPSGRSYPGRMDHALPVGSINAAVFTSPHPTPDLDPLPALVKVIDNARTMLAFAIYSLTHPLIADALLRAHLRDVPIVGVVDASQRLGSTSKVEMLVAAGLDLRMWGGSYHLMHDKLLVADIDGRHPAVAFGSFNWTTTAETSNVEVLVIATGVQVSRVLGPALHSQILGTYAKGRSIPRLARRGSSARSA